MKYQIAIVDANTLTALALKSILQDLVPFAQISTYSSPKELLKEETALIVHAFVSAKIFASSSVCDNFRMIPSPSSSSREERERSVFCRESSLFLFSHRLEILL